MRKARSSKEKPADLEVAPEESSAPRRKGGRRRRDPEAAAGETDGVDAAEEGQTPLRPVLTAISRPVRDDDLNAVPEDPSAPPVVAERPEPVSEPGPTVVTGPDGTPMQVLRLNDLKRMKITELSHMAQDFGVEGTQGLKKQDLIFALLSGIADKKFEVHAEGVMELQSDGFGFLRSADSDYQPSPDDIYVSP
ncbi:MAG TPA: Rho termination factor N-terminal domain-containing protein, partial [Myxococcaceae bacterium]|nr:Rho termination factor N-terminal domain-containing protein [Myxococcaceae bacterium]